MFVGNVPENISTDKIREILEGFDGEQSIKESLDIDDYIKTVDGIQINFKRLRLDAIIIYYTNITDNPGDKVKLQTLSENLTLYLTGDIVNSELGHNEGLEIEEYRTINNEILYVKYDPDNMNYLYMCVNCGTNW